MLGGAHNDLVTGRQGDDQVFLGAGNDRVVWSQGDGNDTIEGEGDTDTLFFNSFGGNENATIFAAQGGSRSLVTVSPST